MCSGTVLLETCNFLCFLAHTHVLDSKSRYYSSPFDNPSFRTAAFHSESSNNQHAHNGLLQSVKVPLPLLPAGCKAAAGIYLSAIDALLHSLP